MRIRSVRARTTLLATGIVALALVAVAYGLLSVLDRSLVATRDDLSRARLDSLVAEAAAGTFPPVITDVGEDGMGQIVSADGQVLAASDGLAGHGPIAAGMPSRDVPELHLMRGVPDDTETEDYRVWAQSVQSPRGPVAVYVGVSPESIGEATRTLRRSLFVGIPVLLVLIALGTRSVVGRALRPVEDIRREVAVISSEAQGRRVPVPPTGDEVASLAATMNSMLARLEAAGVRQREFVGDASHELQTPLTALRAQLEVALAHPDRTEWEGLAAELLVDVEEMERLVRDLLFLAREDAGRQGHGDRLVDLDGVVLEEAGRLRHRLRDDSISVELSRVSAAPVVGDPDELARMVRNLLDNAVAHASSRIGVGLATDGRTVRLEVCDDGPGVPESQRQRVFERFARVGTDRTRGLLLETGRVGTGLGLAIVQGVAVRHGGEVSVTESEELGGACFVVSLPAAD